MSIEINSIPKKVLTQHILRHIYPSTEIRGSEANKAPINELRFDISEIATISKLVIMILLRV
jgi:hypothetical protein